MLQSWILSGGDTRAGILTAPARRPRHEEPSATFGGSVDHLMKPPIFAGWARKRRRAGGRLERVGPGAGISRRPSGRVRSRSSSRWRHRPVESLLPSPRSSGARSRWSRPERGRHHCPLLEYRGCARRRSTTRSASLVLARHVRPDARKSAHCAARPQVQLAPWFRAQLAAGGYIYVASRCCAVSAGLGSRFGSISPASASRVGRGPVALSPWAAAPPL